MTRRQAILVGLCLGWAAPAAWAVVPTNAPWGFNTLILDLSKNVGTTAVGMISPLSAGQTRSYVYIENDSTVLISCSWGVVPTAVLQLGTFSLSPASSTAQGGWKSWTTPAPIPADELFCIAASGTTNPVTAQVM